MPDTDRPTPELPTRLLLPADSRLPVGVGGVTGGPPRGDVAASPRRGVAGDEVWRDPYVSPLVALHDDRDRDAWFHFCVGHHLEFLYWEVTAHACEQAVGALERGDHAAASGWLHRVVDLVRGSAAMLWFCGAFDAEVYDPLLRTSMAAQRDDFSGDMSADFLALMTAKRALAARLPQADLPDERAAFVDAERYWYQQHGAVVLALHPGDSLLKEKVDALAHTSPDFDYARYVDSVVHSDQARHDYDDYFGVVRVAGMDAAAYWTQAVAKIDVVHHHFALPDDVRATLLRADAVLLEVVSQRLLPDGPE